MSHFTEYQIRRFTFLFDQYCTSVKINASKGDTEAKFVLHLRLPVHEFGLLLVSRASF